MEDLTLKKKFHAVIINTLQLESFEITDDMIASDIPGWDSFSHLNIITELEINFNIELSAYEVKKCHNVMDLYELVKTKV